MRSSLECTPERKNWTGGQPFHDSTLFSSAHSIVMRTIRLCDFAARDCYVWLTRELLWKSVTQVMSCHKILTGESVT